jgi:hypothetical protein
MACCGEALYFRRCERERLAQSKRNVHFEGADGAHIGRCVHPHQSLVDDSQERRCLEPEKLAARPHVSPDLWELGVVPLAPEHRRGFGRPPQ